MEVHDVCPVSSKFQENFRFRFSASAAEVGEAAGAFMLADGPDIPSTIVQQMSNPSYAFDLLALECPWHASE